MAGTALLRALPLWELPKAPAQPELPGAFHYHGPSSPVTRAMCPHIYTCIPRRARGCSARGQQVVYPPLGSQGSGQLLEEFRKEESKSPTRHTLSNTPSLEINQPMYILFTDLSCSRACLWNPDRLPLLLTVLKVLQTMLEANMSSYNIQRKRQVLVHGRYYHNFW